MNENILLRFVDNIIIIAILQYISKMVSVKKINVNFNFIFK